MAEAEEEDAGLEDDGEDFLSDEERAAIEDNEGKDGDERSEGEYEQPDQNSDDGGQGEKEDDNDNEQGGGQDDKGGDSDSDVQEHTIQKDGQLSDGNDGDPEHNADKDKEEETSSAAADAGTGIGDVESAYEQKLKELDQKLDDGEIDFDDYKKGLRELEHFRTQALIRQEFQRTKAEDVWQTEQKMFFAANENLSPGKANPIVYNAFAREVNRLAANKAWAAKSGADLLAEAKKNVEAAFGLKPEGPEGKDSAVFQSQKKEKTDGQKAVEKAKKANASQDSPKTLKNIPAGDKNTDNPFAYLDDLEGAEYEAAIKNLNPVEIEAYENSF